MINKHDEVVLELLELFNTLCTLDEETTASLMHIFELKYIPKNTLLIQEGQIVKKIWYLHSGLLRSFVNKNGIECTTWIMLEKYPFTNYRSFITENPSLENIETLEDCIVLETRRDCVYEIYEKYPLANTLGRKFAENYFLRLDAHINSLLFSSAEERFIQFHKNFPSISKRMKSKDLATYLGMTKETCSRIWVKYKQDLSK